MVDGRRVAGRNWVRDIYENIRWCWVGFALASVILQATRTVDMSALHAEVLDKGELTLTIMFDVEIVIRVLAYLPDWRNFFYRMILGPIARIRLSTFWPQIPAIHESSVYPLADDLPTHAILLGHPRNSQDEALAGSYPDV